MLNLVSGQYVCYSKWKCPKLRGWFMSWNAILYSTNYVKQDAVLKIIGYLCINWVLIRGMGTSMGLLLLACALCLSGGTFGKGVNLRGCTHHPLALPKGTLILLDFTRIVALTTLFSSISVFLYKIHIDRQLILIGAWNVKVEI